MWWPNVALGMVFFYLSYTGIWGVRRTNFIMGCINLAIGYLISTL